MVVVCLVVMVGLHKFRKWLAFVIRSLWNFAVGIRIYETKQIDSLILIQYIVVHGFWFSAGSLIAVLIVNRCLFIINWHVLWPFRAQVVRVLRWVVSLEKLIPSKFFSVISVIQRESIRYMSMSRFHVSFFSKFAHQSVSRGIF